MQAFSLSADHQFFCRHPVAKSYNQQSQHIVFIELILIRLVSGLFLYPNKTIPRAILNGFPHPLFLVSDGVILKVCGLSQGPHWTDRQNGNKLPNLAPFVDQIWNKYY